MVADATDDFRALLANVQGNQRQGWEQLYAAHAPAVLGYLRSQNAPHPEDLLGEVWFQVVRDLPRFTGNDASQFRAWLLRIARNRLIDARRREASRPSIAPVAVPDTPDSKAAVGDVGQASNVARLEELLGGLPDNQRAVLYLRFVLDLSQRDVASVLSCSLAAVKMLQARGLRGLARQIGDTL